MVYGVKIPYAFLATLQAFSSFWRNFICRSTLLSKIPITQQLQIQLSLAKLPKVTVEYEIKIYLRNFFQTNSRYRRQNNSAVRQERRYLQRNPRPIRPDIGKLIFLCTCIPISSFLNRKGQGENTLEIYKKNCVLSLYSSPRFCAPGDQG